MLTIEDYFEIILSLPLEAFKALIDMYNAKTIKNERTIIALEILDGLSMED